MPSPLAVRSLVRQRSSPRSRSSRQCDRQSLASIRRQRSSRPGRRPTIGACSRRWCSSELFVRSGRGADRTRSPRDAHVARPAGDRTQQSHEAAHGVGTQTGVDRVDEGIPPAAFVSPMYIPARSRTPSRLLTTPNRTGVGAACRHCLIGRKPRGQSRTCRRGAGAPQRPRAPSWPGPDQPLRGQALELPRPVAIAASAATSELLAPLLSVQEPSGITSKAGRANTLNIPTRSPLPRDDRRFANRERSRVMEAMPPPLRLRRRHPASRLHGHPWRGVRSHVDAAIQHADATWPHTQYPCWVAAQQGTAYRSCSPAAVRVRPSPSRLRGSRDDTLFLTKQVPIGSSQSAAYVSTPGLV